MYIIYQLKHDGRPKYVGYSQRSHISHRLKYDLIEQHYKPAIDSALGRGLRSTFSSAVAAMQALDVGLIATEFSEEDAARTQAHQAGFLGTYTYLGRGGWNDKEAPAKPDDDYTPSEQLFQVAPAIEAPQPVDEVIVQEVPVEIFEPSSANEQPKKKELRGFKSGDAHPTYKQSKYDIVLACVMRYKYGETAVNVAKAIGMKDSRNLARLLRSPLAEEWKKAYTSSQLKESEYNEDH